MTINKQGITLLRVIIMLIYVLLYPMAWFFPVQFGWENGLFENTQLAVCFVGFALATYAFYYEKRCDLRWFWTMIMVIWFIMFWRELSWGACLYPPTTMNTETGGAYPSSSLWYKPIIHPLLWALLAAIVLVFFVKRQYRTVTMLWREKQFPLVEFILAAIGALISTASEGHMHLSLPWVNGFSEGQMQIMEELAELAMYLALFTAQLRVSRTFKKITFVR
ncbi:hypothetical protein DES39_0911 [Orbus hercynius]|uniref:Uncharacterized protein n=1 Tax=Orbus hercynius TaxID=593135 RepID=A0A495RK41_9GAMM|nr:hypothetical protein [Orbus hercynius]RKS87670.1 hypothetical protein DES39_0911 [Orbus hercynius]